MAEEWKCERCRRTQPRLETPPYPGELGQEIHGKVCALCWREWQAAQMMVINEYRISLADKRGLEMLENQMKQFLFGEGSLPPDHTPPMPGK